LYNITGHEISRKLAGAETETITINSTSFLTRFAMYATIKVIYRKIRGPVGGDRPRLSTYETLQEKHQCLLQKSTFAPYFRLCKSWRAIVSGWLRLLLLACLKRTAELQFYILPEFTTLTSNTNTYFLDQTHS